MPKRIFYLSIALAFVVLLEACRVYSFSGASLSPELKTMSVTYFDNRAGNGPASLSQIFTDALQDKFRRETNLSIIKGEGDIQISGIITNYSVVLQAASAPGQDDYNKLTINVEVNYVNSKDAEDQWKKTFSNFQLISSSTNLSSVENTVIKEISDQLADNIFNQALVKW